MDNIFLNKMMIGIARIGADPKDCKEVRLQKALLVYSSMMMATLSIFWGALYLIFEEYLAAAIPLFYSVLSFLSIAAFSSNRKYHFFRTTQLLFPLLLPFFLMLALGGLMNSSAVVLWSLTSPLGALVFAGPRQATSWFLAFLALVAIGAFLDPLVPPESNLPHLMVTIFFAMNIGCTSIVAFILLQYFVNQRDTNLELLHLEQGKSEKLLLNILPAKIADSLKNDNRTIADHYENVSVLFIDIVNFTVLSSKMEPAELVELLNEVFSCFDAIAAKYGLEKIKTIGDGYMVASGIPEARPDHAQALLLMALEIRDLYNGRRSGGPQLSFRMGINSGPVVAGVIGRTKFIYDLWGDTVNTASRMESSGISGQIQVTQATYELIKNDFACESYGTLDIKGKGEMKVWHVLSELHQAVVYD